MIFEKLSHILGYASLIFLNETDLNATRAILPYVYVDEKVILKQNFSIQSQAFYVPKADDDE
jgi:hypothetical protein